MSPYWQAQIAPLNQGIGNLSAGLTRLPMIQAQGRMMAQRGQLYGQQAQEAGARTGLIGAQTEHEKALTGQISQMIQYTDDLKQYTPAALADIRAGKDETTSPNIARVVASGVALSGADKKDVFNSMASAAGNMAAIQGKTPQAAGILNPVAVTNNEENNATKTAIDAANNLRLANAPKVMGPGSTLMTPNGQPLGTAAYSLNPGQNRFAPTGNLSGGLSAAPPAPTAAPTAAPDDGSAADDVMAPPDQTAAPTALSSALAAPIAQGQPIAPKSSAAQTARAQFVKDALLEQAKGNLETNTVDSLVQQYDQATAPQANAATSAPAAASVPPGHIAYLKAHPESADSFDAYYGKGASARYLK